jgi:hypothetical protein
MKSISEFPRDVQFILIFKIIMGISIFFNIMSGNLRRGSELILLFLAILIAYTLITGNAPIRVGTRKGKFFINREESPLWYWMSVIFQFILFGIIIFMLNLFIKYG